MNIQQTVEQVYAYWEQFESSPVRTKTILIVGHHGSGKTRVINRIVEEKRLTRINLNLELGKRLVELPEKRRSLKVVSVLDDILDEYKNNPRQILLDNIELLFSVELQIEPLHLLENCGKSRSIVAAWPGELNNGTLVYAEPGHHEYKAYRDFDSFIITMEEENQS
jgi:hypothetical protein